jgi:hypothetical protein
MKSRLTEIRAISPSARLGLLGTAPEIDALLQLDLAPYVDFVARRGGVAPYPAASIGLDTLAAIEEPAGARDRPSRWLTALPEDPVAAARSAVDLGKAAAVLGDRLVTGGTSAVSCAGTRSATYLDTDTLETVAVAAGCNDGAIEVVPPDPRATVVRLSSGDAIVRAAAGEGSYADGVSVIGARRLSAREIVARHQAAAARQRRAVESLVSAGTMTLTFEAPGFPAPLAITSEAVIFASRDRVEIEQRDIRINGIGFPGGTVPRLPLLEPERVASPPLAIALDEMYRYSLEGEGEAGGVRCHVVRFEPVERGRSLFSGRAWLAIDSHALVKVAAVQTGLRGPIAVSEQVDLFRQEPGGYWLLDRSEVRQIYEGAGHRTPIYRVLTIATHAINPADFAARRAAAHASRSIMLRDTPDGYRYLQPVAPGEDAAPGTAERQLQEGADRVRTLAFGVILDPNISRPLPFAGLSYIDFDLFGTGAQLNGFFGGTYGQVAVSLPSLAGSRWQLAGRAFGIAASYNDRAFVQGREVYTSNLAQRPAQAAVWLLRPLNAQVAVRVGYDFDYTRFARASETSAAFELPATQAAHALRLGLDGQWRGWSGTVWWAGARRAGWRAWGAGGGDSEPYHPRQREFQRAGATVARSFVASPRLVGRVEGTWMSGRDLDRFSRYAFGTIDNRLRGYPAASIRYDRGLVVRSTAAWAARPFLRLDGFLDTAWVRDPGFGPGSRNYTGIGGAVEVPAPFGTLLAAEWGYGLRGIDAEGGQGTHVIRISGYKVF